MIIRTVDPTEPSAVYLHDMLQSEYTGLYGFPDPNPDGGIDKCCDLTGRTYVGYDPATHRPVTLAAWAILSAEDATHTGLLDSTISVATLKRVYTHYSFRGLGLARTMIEHCQRDATDLGMTALVLETGTEQTAAIGMYTSMGYQTIQGYGYYRGQDTSVFLGKALNPWV